MATDLGVIRHHIASLRMPCPACGDRSLRFFAEDVPWYPAELRGERAAPTPWVSCEACGAEWGAEGFYKEHIL